MSTAPSRLALSSSVGEGIRSVPLISRAPEWRGGILACGLARATRARVGGDAMKLPETQIEQFDRDGYLFFPRLFSADEMRGLTDEVPRLYAEHRPENVREKGSDAVRTNFAAHMYSAPFARLARHPRMVEPVVQIFGEPVYMHQFKING